MPPGCRKVAVNVPEAPVPLLGVSDTTSGNEGGGGVVPPPPDVSATAALKVPEFEGL